MNILGLVSEDRSAWIAQEIEKLTPRKTPGGELIRRAAAHARTGAYKLAMDDLSRYQLICINPSPEHLANIQSLMAVLSEKRKSWLLDILKSTIAKFVVKWMMSWMWNGLISFPQIFCMHESFKSINCLADALGMPVADLSRLAGASNRMYTPIPEQKPDGSIRLIYAPFYRLKSIQKKLNVLLSEIPVEGALYGRKGTSQLVAVKLHLGQPMIVAMDVQNFFPSISANMVQCSLIENGMESGVAKIITKLTTTRRLLPQGAPTSPVLAQIVVTPIVRRVRGVVEAISCECVISQYVDDLAFSGPVGIKRAIPTIKKIWREAGFIIHPAKTKTMSRFETQEVLGVWLTDRLRPTLNFTARHKVAREELGSDSPRVRGMGNWVNAVKRANG